MFSPCYFHVIISIGILESNSLSLSTQSRTKWACPNLQQLGLLKNVNCLKSLQGLRVIATYCQKLEDLNIIGVSVELVENCVQL